MAVLTMAIALFIYPGMFSQMITTITCRIFTTMTSYMNPMMVSLQNVACLFLIKIGKYFPLLFLANKTITRASIIANFHLSLSTKY